MSKAILNSIPVRNLTGKNLRLLHTQSRTTKSKNKSHCNHSTATYKTFVNLCNKYFGKLKTRHCNNQNGTISANELAELVSKLRRNST